MTIFNEVNKITLAVALLLTMYSGAVNIKNTPLISKEASAIDTDYIEENETTIINSLTLDGRYVAILSNKPGPEPNINHPTSDTYADNRIGACDSERGFWLTGGAFVRGGSLTFNPQTVNNFCTGYCAFNIAYLMPPAATLLI
ncbi:hypothetical protein [Trabulsiella odontotermitis]|uniref:Uncharacterized protein n=1 Tax=Trabulsiella odontotermitis TaxID=379893 RepID=A0A0L0H042_9ENTR|nr:hypothetical protein [Trabulsiella odontotermitis]KNC94825.1 hypothetical protein GM31_12450 [Trabulsiella odontotermitis]